MLLKFLVNTMLCTFLFLLYLKSAVCEALLWNLPLETTQFIGRIGYLNKLKKEMKGTPIILTGMSGIGKTTLAYYYARLYQNEFDIVWKFDAGKDLEDQIVKFSKQLYRQSKFLEKPNFDDPLESISYMRDWLKYTKLRWILIFDDAKSYGEVCMYLPEGRCTEKKKILITSLSTREQEFSMKIDKFSLQEAIELLRFHLGKNILEEELVTLASTLDCHPLSLRQAISFIKYTPKIDIKSYISLFQNKNKEFWERENTALSKDNFRLDQPKLFTSIELSLLELKKENPNSYRLLLFLTQIHHSHFEGEIIIEWVKNFAENDQTLFGVLLDYALVDRVDSKKCSNEYAIHNYIYDVILSIASKEEISKAKETAEKLFAKLLKGSPDTVFSYFESHPNHINHLDVLCTIDKAIDSEELLDLNVKLLFYSYYAQRKYDYSKVLSSKINSAINGKNFNNKLLVASFYNINAYMKYLSVGVEAAIEESLKAYGLLKTIGTKESEKELVILLSNNLGFFYYWQGNLEKCEICCKEADKISKALNDKTMNLLVDTYKLIIYCDKGDYKKAAALIPGMKTIYENDTFLKRVTGHYQEKLQAILALKRGLDYEAAIISKSAYDNAVKASDGNETGDIVGRTCVPLSISKSRLGKYKEAEAFAKKAISIFDEIYQSSDKNRRQAKAHFALALSLEGQHKYNEALSEYLTAERIYEKNFIQSKIDDVSELLLKIFELGLSLKDDMLIKDYMERHIRIFGHDHPRTIKMFKLIEA